MQALKEKILVHDEAMTHACDVCAELDCLISFASASRSYDYRRPTMTEDNVLDIKQGRWVYARFLPSSLRSKGCPGIPSRKSSWTLSFRTMLT